VFVDDWSGGLRFVPNPEPTDLEVAKLLGSVSRRSKRLVAGHGIELGTSAGAGRIPDSLADESPLLRDIGAASVLGRAATGPRAGRPIVRLGRDPSAPWIESSGARQAHVFGFDLHADVAVPAGDRARLEHLCGYVLRPPIAQDALEYTTEGKILLHIRRPWRDGTRAIAFTPSELLEKLVAIIPKPRVNLLLYHAPPASGDGAETDKEQQKRPRPPRRYFAWADLLRRCFEIDVLACPGCGGRLRLLATIEDPAIVRRVLAHLGLPAVPPRTAPARSPPWSSAEDEGSRSILDPEAPDDRDPTLRHTESF